MEMEELIIFGVIAAVILIGAIATLVKPNVLWSILLVVPALLMLIPIFGTEELAEAKGAGVYVLAFGVIGVFISFFVKGEMGKDQPVLVSDSPRAEIAATREKNVTFENTKKFCSNCGNKFETGNGDFCINCGTRL